MRLSPGREPVGQEVRQARALEIQVLDQQGWRELALVAHPEAHHGLTAGARVPATASLQVIPDLVGRVADAIEPLRRIDIGLIEIRYVWTVVERVGDVHRRGGFTGPGQFPREIAHAPLHGRVFGGEQANLHLLPRNPERSTRA